VIGHHAGESESEIFSRKKDEIKKAGKSFWLIKSFKAKTQHIQEICKKASDENREIHCVFVQASQKGGARPTKIDSVANRFSKDNASWNDIPDGIKVTGKIDNSATALVLASLDIINENINLDLWNYSDFLDISKPVKIMQGASTVCCFKEFKEGMKSRYRKIIAVGRLEEPFAVWLR
jgi:hypothetical protein